jgi:RNA polymerase sigma-54 factor
MSNGMGLQLQQRTDLALTAELRQAIAMLALSATEVQDLVAQEVGDNPCLEFEDRADATPRELVAAEQPLGGESKEADGWQIGTEDGSGQWAVRDEGAGGVLGGDFTTGSGGGGNGQDEDSDGWLNRVANEETLQAHLLRQFEAIVPKGTAEGVRLRVAGYFLIEALDDAGYLRVTVAEVAAQLRLSEDVVDDARAILQTMDPPGIGARDLAECLRLQLHARGQMEVVMEVCLAHLDKVGARDWAGLARLAGTDPEEIRLAVAEIVRCNPKPASAWTRS